MVLTGLLLFAAGCAGAGRHAGLAKLFSGEAEGYAKAVIEQQNRALMAIGHLSGNRGLTDREQARVYALEDKINAACAPLQQAAYRRMNGERLEPSLQLSALSALEGCAQVSLAVEAELDARRRHQQWLLSSL